MKTVAGLACLSIFLAAACDSFSSSPGADAVEAVTDAAGETPVDLPGDTPAQEVAPDVVVGDTGAEVAGDATGDPATGDVVQDTVGDAAVDVPAAETPAGDVDASQPGESRSSVPRNLSPGATAADQQALAAGNRAFAADLYRYLAGVNPGRNLFLSPHSISIALAMTHAGAKGRTATQMASTLHFTLAGDSLHKAFDALDLTLGQRGSETSDHGGAPFVLSIADSIWGQQGFPFLPAYLDLLATYYGAGLMNVDFIGDPDGSRHQINTWVSDQTASKIQDLLPEGSVTGDTRLVLTNAIYFKASWDTPFDAKYTATGTFTRLDGSTVQAPMMHRGDSYAYAETDAYQAVALPYIGKNVSMVVIVPKGPFAAFETSLTGDLLGTLLGSLTPTNGSVTLPRFGTQSAFSLKDALTTLGMTDAFTTADFSGMDGQTDLFISDVIHKSFVAVDEAGTEAAAATAVIMNGGGIPHNPFTLTADKPFVFAIVDGPTGAVLFLGRVLDPSAT